VSGYLDTPLPSMGGNECFFGTFATVSGYGLSVGGGHHAPCLNETDCRRNVGVGGMVGDIRGMDVSNPVVGRAAKAASTGTGTTDSDSTIHDRGSTRDGISASDSGRHREAQRHNRQAHSFRRSA